MTITEPNVTAAVAMAIANYIKINACDAFSSENDRVKIYAVCIRCACVGVSLDKCEIHYCQFKAMHCHGSTRSAHRFI